MRFTLALSVAILSAGILIGCSNEIGPADIDLKSAIRAEMMDAFEVTKLSVEARENLGTKTEPRVVTRFKANLTLTEDLFLQIRPYEAIPDLRQYNTPLATYIRRQTDRGTKLEVAGTMTSVRQGDGWTTSVDLETGSDQAIGETRAYFEAWPYRVIEANSPEAKAWLEEIIANAEARAAAAEAERQRVQAVAEARKARAAAQEAERLAEQWRQLEPDVKQLSDFVLSGPTKGEALFRNNRWEVFTNFELEGDTRKVSGVVEWPGLKARKSVEGDFLFERGQLVLRVKELEILNKEEASHETILGIVYEFSINPNTGEIRSRWGYPQADAQLILAKVTP